MDDPVGSSFAIPARPPTVVLTKTAEAHCTNSDGVIDFPFYTQFVDGKGDRLLALVQNLSCI